MNNYQNWKKNTEIKYLKLGIKNKQNYVTICTSTDELLHLVFFFLEEV